LTGHRPLHDRSGAEVSFTADSRYVVSGSADGAIYFWDLGTEKMEPVPKGEDGRAVRAAPTLTPTVVVQSSSNTGLDQGGGSRAVRFGPRLCVLAVGGQEVVCA
jgi:COMPASS component SWD2